MFDKLIHSSLGNRLMVLVLAAVLLIAGGTTLTTMPVDVFPNLNKPTVTLQVEAGGMAPEEVEQQLLPGSKSPWAEYLASRAFAVCPA
jgi:heavy-metal exporter, HME family